ncbi:MAG: phosphoribosyl-AMP cyclohydrolase [Rhodospirillales bacterium]
MPGPDQTPAEEQEEGAVLRPRFNADGLIAAAASCAETGEFLMLAWMNEEALRLTAETGWAHYYSRSRGALWRKGETSGRGQRVVEMRIDCDQDAVWLRVAQVGGAACHTGRRTCFYRVVTQADGALALKFADDAKDRVFNPEDVYKK